MSRSVQLLNVARAGRRRRIVDRVVALCRRLLLGGMVAIVLLWRYAAGVLRYSGGITGARGHAGDNAGLRALTTALERPSPGVAGPVFGCPLEAEGRSPWSR
jgi:hypothetical protein